MDRSRWHKGEITYADLLSVSDEDLYRKTIAEADKSAAGDKPFFSLLMTSSNRYPYAVPDTFADFPANATRRQKAVRYADYALGRFIEEARSKPWFDNTVFVFVSDRAVKKNRTAEVSPGILSDSPVDLRPEIRQASDCQDTRQPDRRCAHAARLARLQLRKPFLRQ